MPDSVRVAVIDCCFGCGYPTLGAGLCATCQSIEVLTFDESSEVLTARRADGRCESAPGPTAVRWFGYQDRENCSAP